jgi:glucosyl-dolichyl phosphate glucuronosyltransferase
MSEISLSVIICTRNRAEDLANCLHELSIQSREFRDVEIIVVDNGSTDNTREVVERFRRNSLSPINYTVEAREGLCAARNRGRAAATGEILAYIDDDAVPHPGWIAAIREHFAQKLSDCIAGRVEVRTQGSLPEWFMPNLLHILGRTDYGENKRLLKFPECPTGCNFALRGDVFDKTVWFDERLTYYYDEVEFFARVSATGLQTMYRSDVAIDHCISPARLSKSSLRKKARMMGKGAVKAKTLHGVSNVDRLKWTVEYMARTAYVGCAWCVGPRFDRDFTFWLNLGYLKQLIFNNR